MLNYAYHDNQKSLPLMSEKPFQPGRSDPCFCGSGLRFKHCCGSFAEQRPPPHGVRVIEDFLSADQCRKLVDIADKNATTRLKVVNPKLSTAQETVYMLDPRRVAERVDMSAQQHTLNDLVKVVLGSFIEPAYQDKAAWFELPHLLKYIPGGFYHMHADSQLLDPQTGCWDKTLDRDVSMLIYLNDAYTGGALRFDNFSYTLQPKPGMLVFFPSDHRYLHTAMPVVSGTRYAMVSWVALQQAEKVCARAPATAVKLA